MSTATLPKQYEDAQDFLELWGTDYVEFYVGNAKQSAYYFKTAFGFQEVAYAGLETGVTDRTSYVLQQDKIRLVITSSLVEDSAINRHLNQHGDGVKIVALWVPDATKAFEETTKRGAKPFQQPQASEDDNGKVEKIPTDLVLSFFGLVMKLGPIAEWGLNMEKKTISVNPNNFETNKKGIFAAGDIGSYPGKLKLILSGFHEVALASVECFKRARPNEKYRFEFTTSSKTIKDRLGKK